MNTLDLSPVLANIAAELKGQLPVETSACVGLVVLVGPSRHSWAVYSHEPKELAADSLIYVSKYTSPATKAALQALKPPQAKAKLRSKATRAPYKRKPKK